MSTYSIIHARGQATSRGDVAPLPWIDHVPYTFKPYNSQLPFVIQTMSYSDTNRAFYMEERKILPYRLDIEELSISG
jgi:hypothetical protein